MVLDREVIQPISLGIVAANNLTVYLENPNEKVLREHQVDVMEDLRDFFANSETAGYITLPTGAGKTVLITEIASVLGLRTLVVSPTLPIQEQTFKAAQNFSPDLNITNYSSLGKDLSGAVVNTTYQSLRSLISSGKVDPKDFDLVMLDEAHTALGEKTIPALKEFNHALMIGLTATPYFDQIKGYIYRGTINKDDKWTGVFTKNIHEMGLEEAIERGILSNLDIHLVKSGVNVRNVRLKSSGEYDDRDLEKQLNIFYRNQLTMGILAGADAISPDVRITDAKLEEIVELHKKIKGKKTAVFGLGVSQIEDLAFLLRGQGIEARAVYSEGQSISERRKIFEDYEKGDVQIILGVDLIRLGWDSPDTEVGVYMAPTRSGIVAVQELGRILRPSPETGKEKAIAIQLVDLFQPDEGPVTIPNIFDPYYVLKGTRTGFEESKSTVKNKPSDTKINFYGVEIDAFMQEFRSQELLRQRIKRGTVEDAYQAVADIADQIAEAYPEISPLNFYKKLSETLPSRVPFEIREKMEQAIASMDSGIAEVGAKLLVMLNIKTVLSLLETYGTKNPEIDSELIQEGLRGIYEGIKELKFGEQLSSQINNLAKRAIVNHLASELNIPRAWVANGTYKQIIEKIREKLRVADYDELSRELAQETGETVKSIRNYIDSITMKIEGEDEPGPDAEANIGIVRDRIGEVLDTLNGREKRTIELRFGLKDGRSMIFAEVGIELGLTPERVRQIEATALRKLRHPSRSRGLKDFMSEEVPFEGVGYIPDPFAHPRVEFISGVSERVKVRLEKLGVFHLYELVNHPVSDLYKVGITKGEIEAIANEIRRNNANIFMFDWAMDWANAAQSGDGEWFWSELQNRYVRSEKSSVDI